MIPQNQANSNGFIENGVHKNHPANLMALCEKCHLSMHYNGDKVLKRKKLQKALELLNKINFYFINNILILFIKLFF